MYNFEIIETAERYTKMSHAMTQKGDPMLDFVHAVEKWIYRVTLFLEIGVSMLVIIGTAVYIADISSISLSVLSSSRFSSEKTLTLWSKFCSLPSQDI